MELTSQLRKVECVLLCVPCLPLPCPRWLATGSLRRLCSGRGCGARGGGEHVLEWRYVKDGSVSRGSDCAWIDRVQWRAV